MSNFESYERKLVEMISSEEPEEQGAEEQKTPANESGPVAPHVDRKTEGTSLEPVVRTQATEEVKETAPQSQAVTEKSVKETVVESSSKPESGWPDAPAKGTAAAPQAAPAMAAASMGATTCSAGKPAVAGKAGAGASHASGPSAQVCCPLLAAGFVLPKRSWRQRHPVLFWGGMLVLLFCVVSVSRYAGNSAALAGPKIGVVNVEGMIMNSGPIVEWLEQLTADSGVRGILVRVNSPGGAVGPSQEIYKAVKRASATKPVVVSMGALGASGGYYVALGGQEIFASPSTLTASIGVIMDVPNFEGLLSMLGISSKSLATGALKGAGSSTRTMKPEEEAYLQGLLNDMFDEFVGTVVENRKLSEAQVRAVADGRAMTGRQALKAGLVDQLGDFSDAKASLQTKCGLGPTDKVAYIEGPEKPRRWMTELMESVLKAGAEAQQNVTHPQFMYR